MPHALQISASLVKLRAHAAHVQCPVERAIHAIGGRWKMLLLRTLMLDGAQRYNELLRVVAGISPKELTRNLRELEAFGLVARESGGPQKARYSLTATGQQLGPAFELLIPFGEALAKAWAGSPSR